MISKKWGRALRQVGQSFTPPPPIEWGRAFPQPLYNIFGLGQSLPVDMLGHFLQNALVIHPEILFEVKYLQEKVEKKRVGQFHSEVTNYSWRDKISGIKLLRGGGVYYRINILFQERSYLYKITWKSSKNKKGRGGVSQTIHYLSPQRFQQRTTQLAQIMYSKVQLSST